MADIHLCINLIDFRVSWKCDSYLPVLELEFRNCF